MIGWNLYLTFPPDEDGYALDPVFLHLTYDTHHAAINAVRVLETIYGEGRIEIDPRASINTYQPGEAP